MKGTDRKGLYGITGKHELPGLCEGGGQPEHGGGSRAWETLMEGPVSTCALPKGVAGATTFLGHLLLICAVRCGLDNGTTRSTMVPPSCLQFPLRSYCEKKVGEGREWTMGVIFYCPICSTATRSVWHVMCA